MKKNIDFIIDNKIACIGITLIMITFAATIYVLSNLNTMGLCNAIYSVVFMLIGWGVSLSVIEYMEDETEEYIVIVIE